MIITLFDTQDYWNDDPDFAYDEWNFFKHRLFDQVGRNYCVLQGKEGLWDGSHKAGFCGDIEEAVITMINNKDDFKFEDRDGQLWATAYHHDGHNEYHIKVLTDGGMNFYEDGVDILTREQLHDNLMTNDEYSEEICMIKKGDIR